MPTPKKPAAKTAASSKTGNPDDAAVTHTEEVIRIVLDVSGYYDVPVTEPGIRKKSLADNLDYTAEQDFFSWPSGSAGKTADVAVRFGME